MLFIPMLDEFPALMTLVLHDLHNDYPVVSENMLVKKERLSDYNKKMLEKNQLKHVECTKTSSEFDGQDELHCSLQKFEIVFEFGFKNYKDSSSDEFHTKRMDETLH